MDPYVTEPEHIPATDLYADVPLYGRYRPKLGDFSVEPEHVDCPSSAAMRYWEYRLGNGWILRLEDGWEGSSKDSNSSKGAFRECLFLSEERLQDIMFWNDLYDYEVPRCQG